MSAIASSVVIDYEGFGITIDGVDFPWHVAESGPEIDPGNDSEFAIVHLPVIVWGTIQLLRDGKTSTHDREFGDVRAYARDLVRKGFAEDYPRFIHSIPLATEATR